MLEQIKTICAEITIAIDHKDLEQARELTQKLNQFLGQLYEDTFYIGDGMSDKCLSIPIICKKQEKNIIFSSL